MPRTVAAVASHQEMAGSHVRADTAASGKSLPHSGQAVGIEHLQIGQINWQFDFFLADRLVGDAFAAVSDLVRWVQEERWRFIVRAALAHAPAVLMLLVVGGGVDGRPVG